MKILFAFLFVLCSINAASQKQPVTLTVSASATGSVILADYTDNTKNLLSVTLTFNDFNESSWDVDLRLTIENQSLRISTLSSYRSASPVRLIPGVSLILQGADLAPFLDFSNVSIDGLHRNALIADGKLPEGLYTISAECIDYHTGKKLSNRATALVMMRLHDPPVIITPQRDEVIHPSDMQTVTFSWMLRNTPSAKPQYVLHLYEVTDLSVPVSEAAINGRMIKIFESDPLPSLTFVYGAAEPILEPGKTYAFRIQAKDSEGKELYRNLGYSEYNWFHYGYRQNGYILAEYPPDGYSLSLRDERFFRWSGIDNALPGQFVSYTFQIFDSAGFELYNYTGAPMPAQSGSSHFPSFRFLSGNKYIWQVTAYTQGTEVARSAAMHLGGPPYLEAFKAGNHTIKVIRTTQNSLDQLTGEGTVQINEQGELHTVYFRNIRLERRNSELVLVKGWVSAGFSGKDQTLLPVNPRNPEALFISDSLLIDPYSMYLSGRIKWILPHPTLPNGQTILMTQKSRLNFDDYTLTGIAYFEKDTCIRLIEPSDFILRINSSSSLAIARGNRYSAVFSGSITLPSSVKRETGNRMLLPFETPQLLYISENRPETNDKINPVPNTRISIIPKKYLIDLSDSLSPAGAENTGWKGIWLNEYQIELPSDVDKKSQIIMHYNMKYTHIPDTALGQHCYISSRGFSCRFSCPFTDDNRAYFNTFPCLMTRMDFRIHENSVEGGALTGKMHIPFLDDTAYFCFTLPMDNDGFATGYLNDFIMGRQFVFNPSAGEQEITLTINRSVFEQNNRLNLNVDIEWPALGIRATQINNLLLFGNYNIGFGSCNGMVPLHHPVNTVIRDFEVTVSHVGCGREGNRYSIGVMGPIVMSTDVGGYNGPPLIRAYSIDENPLLKATLYNTPLVHNAGSFSQNMDNYQYSTDTIESIRNSITGQLGQTSIAAEAAALANELSGSMTYSAPTATDRDTAYSKASVHFRPGNITAAEVMLLIDIVGSWLDKQYKNDTTGLGDFVAGLNSEQLEELYNYLTGAIDRIAGFRTAAIGKIMENLRNYLRATTESVTNTARAALYRETDSICNIVEMRIDKVFVGMCRSMNKYISEKKLKISEAMVQKAADAARHALITEIRRSIHQSAEDHLLKPLATSVDRAVTSSVTAYIDSVVGKNLYALSGSSDPTVNITGIAQQTAALLGTITVNTLREINLEEFLQNAGQFAEEAFRNISWTRIYENMIRELTGSSIEDFAEKYVKTQMIKGTTQAATNLFGEETGNIVNQLGQNLQLDFSNLEEKLRKGKIDQIIRFDPSYIKVRTKMADFEGWVQMTEDDPVWGDSWQGRFNVDVKLKPSFTVNANYVNGKTKGASGEFEYWFVEINAQGLNLPMTPVPLIFDGAGGKLFHHMRYQVEQSTYLPDEAIDYGAGLRVFIADLATAGRTVYVDMNAEAAWGNNVIDLSLKGGIYVLNQKQGAQISKSYLEGIGIVHYSTDKNEFITSFTVNLNGSPFYCGQGTIEIFISPSVWHVYLGTESSPVSIDLLCAKIISFDGYLMIGKGQASAMLRKYYMIGGDAPSIEFALGKYTAFANCEYRVEAGCGVSWDNYFTIESAYFTVNVSTEVGVKYNVAGKEGEISYHNTPIYGTLLYETKPNNRISGDVICKFTLLETEIECKLKVSKTFN